MTTAPKRERKPKYYLRQSFNYDGWFCICQTANNVMVAEIPRQEVAELVLGFLNDLPGSLLARARARAAYGHLSDDDTK